MERKRDDIKDDVKEDLHKLTKRFTSTKTCSMNGTGKMKEKKEKQK